MREQSINGHCVMQERITHNHADDVLAVAKHFVDNCKIVPWLWKADIKSAFRRIPLMVEHRWADSSRLTTLHLFVVTSAQVGSSCGLQS